MIYDNPAYNLMVFVCNADCETLIDDFHHLLQSCRQVMGEARYDEAWRRPFQITVGWGGLARMISAVQTETVNPVMRLRPLLESFIYENMFLRGAEVNETGGNSQRAFDIVARSASYPIYNAETLRKFSDYAELRGFRSHATTLAQAATEADGRYPHVWEKVMVSGGALTNVPEDLQLPKMEARLRQAYDVIRPDGYLWSELEAEVCGLAVGYLEQAVQDFGESFPLSIHLMQAERQINDLLKDAHPGDRDRLIERFTQARQEACASH